MPKGKENIVLKGKESVALKGKRISYNFCIPIIIILIIIRIVLKCKEIVVLKLVMQDKACCKLTNHN